MELGVPAVAVVLWGAVVGAALAPLASASRLAFSAANREKHSSCQSKVTWSVSVGKASVGISLGKGSPVSGSRRSKVSTAFWR